MLLGVSWSLQAQAQEITISGASSKLVENVYRLDADIEYRFPKPVLEALNNGVVLSLVLDIEVSRARSYVWDETLASLEQHYQIQYHALSEQYLLRNLNSGTQASYPALDALLFFLGRVRDLPIIDAQLLDPSATYQVRIRSRLDFSTLPVPLQMRAYVSRDWWLSSDWYAWNL